MRPRIGIISEHASPLAPPGGVDCGGQNVYVDQVARRLASRGYMVDVFTRRDSSSQPARVDLHNGVRIIHVAAGPPRQVPKEELLPFMDDFTRSRSGRTSSLHAVLRRMFWPHALETGGALHQTRR